MRFLKTVFGLGLAGAIGAAHAQAVTAVPQLDLSRFVGTWYEVARLPNKAEKKCVSDNVQLYALADKVRRFQRVTSCKIPRGYPDVRNKDGRVHDKNGDGTLETTTLFFFHGKTWVLDIAPDYSWAVMGSPNHKVLWLLARKAAVEPEAVAAMTAKAASEGFDTSKLIQVNHTLARRSSAAADGVVR